MNKRACILPEPILQHLFRRIGWCRVDLLPSSLTWSHVWLCYPVGSCPPGSSVHGILQARTLEWIVMPSSRRSPWPRGQTCVSYVSCIGRWVLYHLCPLGSPLTVNERLVIQWRLCFAFGAKWPVDQFVVNLRWPLLSLTCVPCSPTAVGARWLGIFIFGRLCYSVFCV